MLKRAQQFALWQAARVSSIVAGYEALAGLDPLVRWLAKRRVRRLVKRADFETTRSEPRHRLLLAYLLGGDVTVPDADDIAEVEARAQALAPPSSVGARGLWVSGALLLSLLAIGAAGLALQQWLRPFSPLATGAGRLLGRQLSVYVMALANGDAAATARTGSTLKAEAPKALGEPAARQLSVVLGSMERLASNVGAPAPELIHAYEQGVVKLDAALQTAGHPYFLDAELRGVGERVQPLLMSYYVQGEARVAGSSPNIRVVRLWRLDDLNVTQGLVGFTRPGIDAAVVLLDQAEEALVRVTLPAAAPSGRAELVDDDTRASGGAWVTELEEQATKVTLAYYQSLGAERATAAMRIGTLLLRRRNLVRRWQAQLAGMGLQLNVPGRLFPDVDYAKELWLKIPGADLEDWRNLQAELKDRLPAFEELRESFVQAIEQHEVQHRFDYARGSLPVPEFLCQMTGCADRQGAPEGSFVARARDEASAYLAQLARAPGSPTVELVSLSTFILDSNLQQGAAAYAYAAVTVYVALGRALVIDVEAVIGRGSVRRERVAKLAMMIWGRPDAELRAAARRAYQTEYGVTLPEVRLEGRKSNTAFRPELQR